MKTAAGLLAGLGVLAIIAGAGGPGMQVPSTIDDFFQPGSQPNGTGAVEYEQLVVSATCRVCHEYGETDLRIYSNWQGSMMAHAARDPMFHACLAIANQDAAEAGDMCIRCHTPKGWIEGRSSPTDGSALGESDFDGVTCSVCHRMVDPVYKEGISPVVDQAILSNIDPLPVSPGGGNFILDPQDFRRGPFDDIVTPGHTWLHSPFHSTSNLCATCHDVGNPMFWREPDGTYSLTELGEPHPTGNKYEMFPLERTFSEWANSAFASGGVDMGGRFGGNKTVVSTCQDCHMPDIDGQGCSFPDVPFRHDMPSHVLIGANAWALDVIANMYPEEIYLPYIEAGRARAISMLERAATLEASQLGRHINIRVINETGHKLPTGYPEGRRMWLNVQVFDVDGGLIEERGHYDDVEAELTTSDTTVYEIAAGLDQAVADATGLSPGESFHFALNNVIFKDNRIPPRGFTNAAFDIVQARPVGTTYADGTYWDDTLFALPRGAATVEVQLYYQSASKEYITFLRDENRTNDTGDILYEQWEQTDKSPPVLMASTKLTLDDLPPCVADADCADADGDGIRDALCARWRCIEGVCTGQDVGFGDIGGAFGDCPPDGVTDGHDHFHALTCFGNVDASGVAPYPCETDAPFALAADIGSPYAACRPDGVCDGHDVFMIGNAMSHEPDCLCPGDGGHPAPRPPVHTVARARLGLRPDRREIRPGDEVRIEAVLLTPLRNMRGYQLHVAAAGGRAGHLELVDIEVGAALDAHRPPRRIAFPVMTAYNVTTRQMFAGVPEDTTTLEADAVLATFTFRATAKARGTFVVDLRYDETMAGDRTFLFAAESTARIAIEAVKPATITVRDGSRQRGRARR